MKRTAVIFIFCLITTLGVPTGMYALFVGRAAAPSETDPAAQTDGSGAAGTTAEADPYGDTISVFMAEADRVEELDLLDYVVGVVAAEMPVSYAPEALKAQAAVSLTLARYMQKSGAKADLGGAVISSDYRRHQAYLGEAALRALWGERYDENIAVVRAAVDAVSDVTITYGGQPILAVFHAISAGETESAANVWGGDYPYLTQVDSSGDRLSAGFRSEETLPAAEFFQKLGLTPPEDPASAVRNAVYSEAGYLRSVEICGTPFTGLSLRQRLGLRSSAVSIDYADGDFVLSVRGYGHGVGMSQYGADYLARQGYSWQEIVAHFYPGTEIRRGTL